MYWPIYIYIYIYRGYIGLYSIRGYISIRRIHVFMCVLAKVCWTVAEGVGYRHIPTLNTNQ